MLKQVNIPVELASTAEEAWVLLQSRDYAGAIIDLALPGKDGFQLLKDIRMETRLKDLRCIAVTAYHTPELKHDALKIGFDGYFAKPLNRTLFIGAISDLIF